MLKEGMDKKEETLHKGRIKMQIERTIYVDIELNEILIEYTNEGEFLICPLYGRIIVDNCKPSCDRFINLFGTAECKRILGVRCRKE